MALQQITIGIPDKVLLAEKQMPTKFFCWRRSEAVSNTSPLLEIKAGMWISAEVRQWILVLAGEG